MSIVLAFVSALLALGFSIPVFVLWMLFRRWQDKKVTSSQFRAVFFTLTVIFFVLYIGALGGIKPAEMIMFPLLDFVEDLF